MLTLLGRRLLIAPLTFLGITFVVFVLIHALPGDPLTYFIGQSGPGPRSAAAIAELRAEYRLDEPLLMQYAAWLTRAAQGDLGHSFVDGQPVSRRIAEKLPNTVLLNVAAFVLALLVALPVGIFSGARSGGVVDRWSNAGFLLLFSIPLFWAALLLMHFLAMKYRILPLYGMGGSGASQAAQIADRLRHMVLPVICLTYGQLAFLARYAKTAVEESMHEDFVRASRARGLSEFRVLTSHVLPNAFVPFISLFGVLLPFLISGSVIVEKMFQWDGVGRLFLGAILRRDYPVIMGMTLFTAVVVLLVNIVTDVLYAAADPRIRLQEEGR